MIRNYNVTWYPTKDGEEFTRKTFIKLSKPTGETKKDAPAALDIFCASFGGLQKNTIVKIVEMDENGQIGEDIVPTENSAICPTAFKK